MSASQPTILVTGKNRQVGWELQRSLSHLGRLVACDRSGLDLADSAAIRSEIQRIKPDVIVNAAAYTAVDKAEEDVAAASQINALAPGVIAEEAKKLGCLVIHYSTDYVFNGEKSSPYTEDDETGPVNVYGRSKLDGEQNIIHSGADYLILRTSWVYAARGHNFMRSMLRLASEREQLNIVDDQIGSPTPARLIADVTANILWQSMQRRKSGEFESAKYNLVTAGSISWHGFASRIVEYARQLPGMPAMTVKQILPILSSDYPTPAKRPANSRLSVDKLSTDFCLHIPDWDQQLKLCMQEFE
jgi:dTDP-4-dehydrorhamnose reductase